MKFKNKKIKKRLAFLLNNGYNNKNNIRDSQEWEQIPLLTFEKSKRREELASIEEKVTNLIEPIIEKIGYELYDVEYAKEGKNYFLRIFIDNEKGIDLNDCEKVNNEITDILDEKNYIKEQYFLEVSSPGIERILRKNKHLEKNIGKEINIKLFKKDENGNKEYFGDLLEYDENYIKIKQNDNEIKIERKNISQIKTVYNW